MRKSVRFQRLHGVANSRIVASLHNTIKTEGIEEILINRWNHLAVDTERFECDAYEFERQVPQEGCSFRGEYMSHYSWTEFSVGRGMRIDEESD